MDRFAFDSGSHGLSGFVLACGPDGPEKALWPGEWSDRRDTRLCPSDAPYYDWNVDSELSDLLIDCSLSLALRTMRLTRPHRVKSDADEKDGNHQELLTRCYQAPGRRHRGMFPASVALRSPPLARTYALKSRPPASMLIGVIL